MNTSIEGVGDRTRRKKSSVQNPKTSFEESVARELRKALESHAQPVGAKERDFGLKLRRDGTWEHHESSPGAMEEEDEPSASGVFDEASEGRPVRTLTDFALYDEHGRLVPVEYLDLEGGRTVIGFGTLVEPRKSSPKCPFPAPAAFGRKPNAVAAAVLLQPPPGEPAPEAEPETLSEEDEKYIEALKETRILLERLLVTLVTVAVLKETGLGKKVNKFRNHSDDILKRLAVQVKQNWVDILEKGGQEPGPEENAFLMQASHSLESLTEKLWPPASAPSALVHVEESDRKHSSSSKKIKLSSDPLAAIISNPDQADADVLTAPMVTDETGATVFLSVPNNSRENAADLIASYAWNGKEVVPDGPHGYRLNDVVEYIRINMNVEAFSLKGWKLSVHRRKTGSTNGQTDSYFFSPQGKRFRSKNEIGKFLGIILVDTSKAERKAASKAAATSAPSGSRDKSKKHGMEDALNVPSAIIDSAPLLPPSKYCEARRVPNEFRLTTPSRPLDSMVERPEDSPLPDVMERVGEELKEIESGQKLRVRLIVTGWSISVFSGFASLYIHTDTATYCLAGDLAVCRPAKFYRSFFNNAFLAFHSCRLVVRAFSDYGPVVNALKLDFPEICTDVLERAERCPGHCNDPVVRIIVPVNSLPYYYYAAHDIITADFVVSRQPFINEVCVGHFNEFAKLAEIMNAAPFFNSLLSEHNTRKRLVNKLIDAYEKEDEKKRALMEKLPKSLKKDDRERVSYLVKKFEDGDDSALDLYPDDQVVALCLRNHLGLATAIKTVSQDPTVQKAVEKVLSAVKPPSAARPNPIMFAFDPALVVGADMTILKSFQVSTDKDLTMPLGTQPKYVQLSKEELSYLRGAFAYETASPVADMDELGETISRSLAIWDGACIFARTLEWNVEEEVGSFCEFRRRLLQGYAVENIFVELLRTVARQDLLTISPPSGEADAEKKLSSFETDTSLPSTFDLASWPMPEWIVDESTWPVMIHAALCFWFRYNSDSAVLDALSAGEISEFTSSSPGADAGRKLRDQVAPKDLDFIALCDDGLRKVMKDPEAEYFTAPVDRVASADYDETIKRPMDIGTIRERIKSGFYDPKRAPPGAYVWDAEMARKVKESMASYLAGEKEEFSDDENESEDEADENSMNLLDLLTDHRAGGVSQNTDKRPDCGKCKFCLDKPRFGGFDTLRMQCAVKQSADQQLIVAAKDLKRGRTKELSRRRQGAQMKETIMNMYDEMYYAHDSLGGGHEGLAADVRCVFRNCRLYNKGTTPIYRAATKLDTKFGEFYFRYVAGRDPKYAALRVVTLPESIVADAKRSQESQGEMQRPVNNELSDVVDFMSFPPSLTRTGYPSLIEAARSLNGCADFSVLDIKTKLVVLQWLLDRCLESVPAELMEQWFSTRLDAKKKNPLSSLPQTTDGDVVMSNASEAKSNSPFEATGMTRDYWRVWASPRMVRETGGLVLVENMLDGKWGYYNNLKDFETFIVSLDVRGRREYVLKTRLLDDLELLRETFRQCAIAAVSAPQKMAEAKRTLADAMENMNRVSSSLSELESAATLARAEANRVLEEKHAREEEERRVGIESIRKAWAEAKSSDGKTYFYHVETRVTTWTKPKELGLTFVPKPVPALAEPTKEEVRFNQVLAERETAKATVTRCQEFMAKFRTELSREKILLDTIDTAPRVDSPLTAEQLAFEDNLATVISSILCVENFCLGPKAELSFTALAEWEKSPDRLQWINAVKSTVTKNRETDLKTRIADVISQLKRSLEQVYNVFIAAGAVRILGRRTEATLHAFHDARRSIQVQEWRWITTLRNLTTLPDIAALVAHLRQLVGNLTLATPAADAWERDTKRELGEQAARAT